MRARIGWSAAALLALIPLAGWFTPEAIPLGLKANALLLLGLAAWRPHLGLAALLVLGPSAVPLAAVFAPPLLGGAETLVALVLAALTGAAVRWSVSGAPPAGPLARPALLLATLLLASIATVAAVDQMATAPWREYLARLFTYTTRDVFAGPGDVPIVSVGLPWLTGLALLMVVERAARQAPAVAILLARALAWGLAGAATFSLIRLLQITSRAADPGTALWSHLLSTRISPHFPDVNAIGSFFAMAAVVWVLIASRPAVRSRVPPLAAAALTALALWLTQSRAALGAALIVLGAGWPGLWTNRGRRRTIATVIVAGLLLAAAAAVLRTGGDRPTAWLALQIRYELAQIGVTMTRQAPVFGVGLGEFQQRSIPLVSADLINRFPAAAVGENAHNQFIQTAAELGVPGLLVLLWLLGTALRAGLSAPPAEGAGLWARAWAAGLAALLLSAGFGHPWLTPYVWLLTCAALGLTTIAASASRPQGLVRAATVAGVVLVLALAPLQAALARRAIDLDHRVIGASAERDDRDGIPYRIAGPVATYFVRTTAQVLEFRLRADEGACRVAIDIDDQPANAVDVDTQRWYESRFVFREAETRWSSRRVQVRVVSGACRLLIGRPIVLD